ncbi:uncharacterized protein ARMOST_21932 [Armillaria ostoyae]|uniref:Uncharacterized protein n=1 Tax=Armillaria ostoyae TaxID=47428 RepID=A0A284SBI8_ARMOS|nr:uncharacterized protein ARMOST_21932 [Armillaria ostoyae]
MTTQNSIPPPDLTDVDRAIIFQILDAELNSVILYSLLIGIYTGIVAVTLRNIYMNKSQPIRRVMVLIVVLLHTMTIFNFASCWAYIDSMFIDNGWNFWTIHLSYSSPSVIVEVGMGATGAVCTILADSTMIWRCWMVWGRRWLAILLPTFVLIAAIVFKIIGTYELYNNTVNNYALAFTLYSSLVLAMTLWCTLLIIYRIVSVARAGRETGGGLGAYRNIIEVLVESSVLYSAFLILYVVFNARDPFVLAYFDVLAGIARGIAPTLLVGRVAAGHSRPDDSWRGSVISGSIRFGTHSGGQLSLYSATSDDLEAQRQRDGEYNHHIAAESQGDTVGSDSFVHEDGPRSQREGDNEYGHFVFKSPQDGAVCIDLQSVIQGRVPS